VSLDGNMNVVLEQATEYIRGEPGKTYNDAFIRGNNGNIYIFIQNFLNMQSYILVNWTRIRVNDICLRYYCNKSMLRTNPKVFLSN
jgi:LSM domain